VFQTASARKLSAPLVTFSLMLHAAAILVLCLVNFPGSPPRPRARSVTLIAPPLGRERHAWIAAAKLPTLRPPPRRFNAPPRLLLKLTLNPPPVPAPAPMLVLQPVRVPMPDPAPAELPWMIAPPGIAPPAVQTGTFDLAKLHSQVPSPPVQKVTVKTAGFASAENAPRETATRRERIARVSGFTPESAPLARSPAHPETREGGFGDASVVAPSPLSAHTAADSATVPAEILEKPRPSYTAEARRLNIEGEVLLEVVFEASGETKVGRVIRGLGHGLDEAAMAATRQIHFRPALHDGVAIDSAAVVHVIFELAN
jgi:TonB family protein